ncbi:ribonuclease HII [bacterium]|mgnify:FL=1|jgi:ribonuclease HII|nr:ribonuclease HII [bacterium]MBT4251205.1 ribonuclease HII [bacterium]MBT4598003.1 ribonuclease HII [bacterium]MBT6753584.1 ribonuclease HII [bacterium]MBT7037699.1 ribonuclease HII [bacterium]
MDLPKIIVEKELAEKGVKIVLGVDEVGRGPLAGPVVAAAAWVNPLFLEKDFEKRNLVRDSKKLSEKQRAEICEYILKSDDFVIGIGEVSHRTVDKINILNASLLAMKIAVEDVMEKFDQTNHFSKQTENLKSCLLVDGNREIPKMKMKQRLFSKGDARIFSIAAASICAKVYRDELMQEYHKKWPRFGFDTHKGYGTKKHMDALQKVGLCQIHRKSFGPVKDLLTEALKP